MSEKNQPHIQTFESKTQGERGHVVSSRAPKPVGPYPHARREGNLLFLSGVGPRQVIGPAIPGAVFDEAGIVIDYDVKIQTKAVIENVTAILEEAGSSLANVIDVQVFLTDMKRDFRDFNEVYATYFETIGATRTTIEVGALPTPIAVELKVIARVERSWLKALLLKLNF